MFKIRRTPAAICAAIIWNGVSVMLPPVVGIPMIVIGTIGLIVVLRPNWLSLALSKFPTATQGAVSGAIRFLDGFSDSPRRDVWVLNALHFIAFGSWELQDEGLAPGQSFNLIGAMRALEQAALDGDVPIWGKVPLGGKYVLIAPSRWEHLEIRERAVLDGDPKRVYARRKHGNVFPAQYRELKTNKAKVLKWRAVST